jgi:hypothetical protein
VKRQNPSRQRGRLLVALVIIGGCALLRGRHKPEPCIADPGIAVALDACSAVKAELAFFSANKFYQSGLCTSLPGFTQSPGVPCVVALTTCVHGLPGFIVQTSTADRRSPFRQCVFDACSVSNKPSCS